MEVEGCKVITLHIHNLFTLSSYWTGRRQIRRLRQSTRNGVGKGVKKVKCAQCRASLKTIYLCVRSYQQKRWHSESRRNSNKCYKIAVCFCFCYCYSNKSYHKVVFFCSFALLELSHSSHIFSIMANCSTYELHFYAQLASWEFMRFSLLILTKNVMACATQLYRKCRPTARASWVPIEASKLP